MDLVLCHACRRHVAAHEAACPFCGSAAFTRPAIAAPFPSSLSRAQRYAAGAAIAAASLASACKGSTPAKSGGDDGAQVIEVPSDAGPSTPIATSEPTTTATATTTATTTATATATATKTQATPDDPTRWRRNRKCLPNGGCPPYGCVFPDEACDVVSI